MRRLNANNMAVMYIFGAQMYQIGNRPEKALEALTKYTDVCTNGFFPVEVRGDEFFDKVVGVFAQNTNIVPRNDAAIKDSMLQELKNPVFESLQGNPEYDRLIRKFTDFIGAK
jgi:hypothetical protein